MAREYARVRVRIWADTDFRALSVAAQHLYYMLLTSPTLNLCGVADWRPRRLAAMTADADQEHIENAAKELEANSYIVIDDDMEEVLIRSFVRHDGLIKTPNIASAMAKDYAAIASTELRACIVHELQRLHEEDPDMKGWDAIRDLLAEPSDCKASRNPSANPSPKASGDGSHIPQPTPTTTTNSPQPRDNERTAQGDGGGKGRKKRATQLPKDWSPTPEHEKLAAENNIDMQHEANTFRAHAEATGRVLINWNAGFTQWLLKARPNNVRPLPATNSLWKGADL